MFRLLQMESSSFWILLIIVFWTDRQPVFLLGTQVVYQFFPLLSAARDLSSFQLLPASVITDLLQLFFGIPVFLLLYGFQSKAAFGISPPSFLSVWPIHISFLFLISKFISPWPVAFRKSLFEIIFGHHIVRIYLRHLLTKVCILRRISPVTSHASHPYKSTDFTEALKILILVSFRIDVDSHTFLNLENDPLAFCKSADINSHFRFYSTFHPVFPDGYHQIGGSRWCGGWGTALQTGR
jgi:hypothetical protein